MISARIEHLLIKLQSLRGSAVCTPSVNISSSGPNFPLVFCTTAGGLKGLVSLTVCKGVVFRKNWASLGAFNASLGSLVTGCNCWGRWESLEIRNYKANLPRKQSNIKPKLMLRNVFQVQNRTKRTKMLVNVGLMSKN